MIYYHRQHYYFVHDDKMITKARKNKGRRKVTNERHVVLPAPLQLTFEQLGFEKKSTLETSMYKGCKDDVYL